MYRLPVELKDKEDVLGLPVQSWSDLSRRVDNTAEELTKFISNLTAIKGKNTKYKTLQGLFINRKTDKNHTDNFNKRKADLFLTYNNLVERFPFFKIFDERSFSSSIDKDFIHYCLTNYGALPKKLRSETKDRSYADDDSPKNTYRKGYSFVNIILESKKESVKRRKNHASYLHIPKARDVAYFAEQHFYVLRLHKLFYP